MVSVQAFGKERSRYSRTEHFYPEAMVDEARRLHEDEGWSYLELSKFFNVPKATIQSWCKYRRR